MLTVAVDPAALAVAAAERITSEIERAGDSHGNACVCLTGGSTPRALYALLADDAHPWRGRIRWDALHLFWGDERRVPPDHHESNYRMALETLLSRVPIPKSQVHRIRTEIADPDECAEDYARELREGFAHASRSDLTFDVLLLGVGDDAHIASIFPGSPLLDGPRTRNVAAVWAPHLNTWRITLTPERLLDARTIVMLVTGANKAPAVHAALEGDDDPARWPAQILRAAGDRVEWFIDRPAAADLRVR